MLTYAGFLEHTDHHARRLLEPLADLSRRDDTPVCYLVGDRRARGGGSIDDAEAADRHETQYFEMFVNRGIYHKGWTAVTRHSTPWVMSPEMPAFDDDVWELYAPEDWSQTNDLSEEMPEKLHELQRLFL